MKITLNLPDDTLAAIITIITQGYIDMQMKTVDIPTSKLTDGAVINIIDIEQQYDNDRQDSKHKRWQDEPITEKQRQYIAEMEEFSIFGLPHFEGKTKGDAAEYIDKYRELAHKDLWATEHGYD